MINHRGPASEVVASGNSGRSRDRHGLAHHELMVILVALSLALCVIFLLIPESAEDDPVTSPPREATILPELVTQLDDHLLSSVQVTRFRPPPENSPIVFTSHVLIFQRAHESSEMLILEVVTTDRPDTPVRGMARVWTLVDSQLATELNDPFASHSREIAEIESIRGLSTGNRPNLMFPIEMCDESIRQFAPLELRNSGFFVDIGECDLTEMGSLQGFPLAQAAAAIQSYREHDSEPTDDLPTLLSHFDAPTGPLTTDDAQALIHTLIYRLLDYLPEE